MSTSTHRQFVAWFDCEEDVLEATHAARKAGMVVDDVYAPYPIHGIDEALGLPQSRLSWVCFGAGLSGLVLMAVFLWWMTSVAWPLNVGGKPHFSLPAFVPVIFEFTILSAGLSTVAALFVAAGLWPGKRREVLPRVTNDRFALSLIAAGSFDEAKARKICAESRAVDARYLDAEPEPAPLPAPAPAPEPALPLAARTAEVKP